MPSLVRILLYVGLFLGFGPAMAAPVIDAVPAGSRSDQSLPIHFIQYDDPCTDGRYSDGKPHNCRELLRMLDRRDRYRERHDNYPRQRYDPCTDGWVSDGRPRSCRKIMRWLRDMDEDEDWRPRKHWE
ncbi:hypothetical protein NKI51_12945 [Mesorhizobium australicum]|uniref:hypothetical protein n=1 Tax=Mesorhizobium TaxID=68287 RepID=UPI0003CF1403|nr:MULTISPECIES: hypothetical protein [unclassified Mesorhizobium]ESY97642.1 hypothetical protein X741_02805 [Mesorhizobium sp. LNHC229A00]ESZ01856.1 hypothetical protein X738_00645 [Mesorhizobium sp. LNHC209A00]